MGLEDFIGGPLDSGLLDTLTATAGPCTVLLGPPGSGKTTALRTLERAAPQLVRVISLGRTGSEDRLRELVSRALEGLCAAGQTASTQPLLALDSLDESSLTTTQLSSFIDEVADSLPDGIRLVLACRTAAWLPGVHSVLVRKFAKHLTILDLAQLSKSDMAAYADSAGTDGAAFLKAVEGAKALPLASNPNTLHLLLDIYLEGPGSVLPTSQASLFERSLQRLLQEPNEQRWSLSQTQHSSPIMDCAGRLAVLGLFSGRPTYRLRGDAGPEELSLDDLHYWIGDPPANWTDSVTSVLQSALFEGAGDMAVRFAHQTLIEYLAARYLVSLDLDVEQIDGLLRGRGGLLAPQVQAVAAWLFQQRPDRFRSLLAEDPAAFALSGVEIDDAQYKRILVMGLLGLARRSELLDMPSDSLRGLAYPGIGEDLQPAILDESANFDSRYLATRLARENGIRDLSDTFTRVALNSAETIALRIAAGHSILEFGNYVDIAAIAQLVESSEPADDPDDELFGLGLKAKLRLSEPLEGILHCLRAPKNDNLFGTYRSFLVIDLPAALQSPHLSRPDLIAALDWATALEVYVHNAAEGSSAVPEDRLLDAILVSGLRRLAEPGLNSTVAGLISLRMESRHRLLRHRAGGSMLPELSTDDRRALLDEIGLKPHSDASLYRFARSGLLLPEDFLWLLERAKSVRHAKDQARWVPWIRMMFDRRSPTHAAALTEFITQSPEYQTHLASLLEPIEDTLGASQELEEDDPGPNPTNDEIHSHLLRCLDSEDADAFLRLCHFLRFTGGENYASDDVPRDIGELPGWPLLSTTERGRVVDLARRYLLECAADLGSYLGSDRVGWEAIAGVRAFVVLKKFGVTIDLSDARWGYWAPAFIVWGFDDGADGDHSWILAEMSDRALPQLVEATERHIVGREHEWITLERILPMLGMPALPWMLHLVDDGVAGARAARTAFERVAELDEGVALRRLPLLLADSSSTNLLSELIASAIITIGASAWDILYQRLLSDAELAKGVITSLSGRHGRLSLSEEQTAQLWELTAREFPRVEDPDTRGLHAVGQREQVSIWRDRLIPMIAGLGTGAAVETLTTLAQRTSEGWLWHYVAQAKAARRKGDWSPLRLEELTRVLDDRRQILRSSGDLLEVVTKAVADIQRMLAGATPEATLLWNHRAKCDPTPITGCLPRSEEDISDYVRNRLAPAIPQSVVNREVQVVRLNTRGVGRRTDLLVEVPAAGATDRVLRVVVEVKGCWNEEVPTALKTQLVDTYLARWHEAAGLFLVAWFSPEHGAKRGTWLRDPVRSNPEALQKYLGEQAEEATIRGAHTVRALLLDCSMPT